MSKEEVTFKPPLVLFNRIGTQRSNSIRTFDKHENYQMDVNKYHGYDPKYAYKRRNRKLKNK